MQRPYPFQLRNPEEVARELDPLVHLYGPGAVCDTEKRGFATPDNLSPEELVLDASEGFIPLWAKDMTLGWRFQERSLLHFEDPEAVKAEITGLFREALMAWGPDVLPIKFSQRDDLWDFEVVVEEADKCTPLGCTLARAFFPDGGRHQLVIYPRMFTQSRKEQVDTLCHEFGHTLGLRHFFANVRETDFPSEVFGTHDPFTIMNYGSKSEMTDADRADLKQLYQMAWSGELTEINGTPIRLVQPFSTFAGSQDNLVAVGQIPALAATQTGYALRR
jgi:hypothetical protein